MSRDRKREREIKYDPDEKNTIVGKCNAEQELTNWIPLSLHPPHPYSFYSTSPAILFLYPLLITAQWLASPSTAASVFLPLFRWVLHATIGLAASRLHMSNTRMTDHSSLPFKHPCQPCKYATRLTDVYMFIDIVFYLAQHWPYQACWCGGLWPNGFGYCLCCCQCRTSSSGVDGYQQGANWSWYPVYE